MRKKTSQILRTLRTLRFQPKNAHPEPKVSKLSNKNLATLATLNDKKTCQAAGCCVGSRINWSLPSSLPWNGPA